ncbi:MAG: glycosyltransferase [Candidatus Zixiibacteriota bacterium]|nr:MAG: glycosyltransferase [candidate division Zixibacteria bacterium]
MPTRLLDLDLNQPLPDLVDLGEYDRLTVIAWKGRVPLGLIHLPDNGRTVTAEALARVLKEFLGETVLNGVSEDSESPLPAFSGAGGPRISVIIPTRGRTSLVQGCLEAIRAQTYPPHEVLVVDNDPPDASTWTLLSEQYREVHYVMEPARGVRFARNRGLMESRGEVVAFTDDDCRPEPDWLKIIAMAFAARPGLGCVTGPVLPRELETRAQELLEARCGFIQGFNRKLFLPHPVKDFDPAFLLQTWRFGAGSNMAFRREALEELGYFDETMLAAEDLEMFYRILRGGRELAYEPGAVVRQRHTCSYAQMRRRMFEWGWGYASCLTKVIRYDSRYRRRALAEMATWLWAYQVRGRIWPRLRGRGDTSYPLNLMLMEFWGALAGVPGYFLGLQRARRQGSYEEVYPPE